MDFRSESVCVWDSYLDVKIFYEKNVHMFKYFHYKIYEMLLSCFFFSREKGQCKLKYLILTSEFSELP